MDFPIKNGGSFHSYVKLPEGKPPFSHGFPMVFLWFSYMFWVVFVDGITRGFSYFSPRWMAPPSPLHHHPPPRPPALRRRTAPQRRSARRNRQRRRSVRRRSNWAGNDAPKVGMIWSLDWFTLWWTNILPWKITIFNGKIHYKWWFSIAMLVHQRVRENLNRKPMGFYHQIVWVFL